MILALNYARQKKKKQVRESLEMAWNNGADVGSFHYYYSVTSGLLGDGKKMESEILLALKESPHNAQYHCYYARILRSKRKYAKALEELDAALTVSPEYTSALKTKAEILTTLGRKQEAREISMRLLQMQPDESDPHAMAGRVALHQGKAADAFTHYQEALRLNPNSQEARDGVMEALRSRFILYRWYFAFNSQLMRLPIGSGVAIFIALRVLTVLGTSDAPVEARIVGYVAAALVFGVLFARLFITQVSNMVLILHPLGRLLLNRHQRAESIWLGISIVLCLIAATAIAGSRSADGFGLLACAGLSCFLASLMNYVSTVGIARWVFFWVMVTILDGAYVLILLHALFTKT